MDSREYGIIDLLFPVKKACYQIPPFQRNFQWEAPQVHRLVCDIRRATFEKPHWIGVALIAPSSQMCPLKNTELGHTCYDILDGQQRFITLRIWCIALIDEYFRQLQQEPELYKRAGFADIKVHNLDTEDWEKLKNGEVLRVRTYNERSTNLISGTYLYFRYLLLVGLDALLEDEELTLPGNSSDDISLFDSWLERKGNVPVGPEDILGLLKSTTERLTLTALEHEPKDEDIEIIFETLNSSRVELGQFDLFRNYLLINSNRHGKEQTDLYNQHMAKSERAIQDAALNIKAQRKLDRFFYDFLISQATTSGTIKSDATAREFKRHWEGLPPQDADVKDFLDSKLTPSMISWITAFTASSKLDLKGGAIELSDEVVRCLMRIENLSKGPFVPLTTRLILDWAEGPSRIDQKPLLASLKLVETYAARSLLGNIRFSPMRRQIMAACWQIYGLRDKTLEEWVVNNSPSDERIRSVLTQSVAVETDGKLVDPDPSNWPATSDLYGRARSRQIRAIFDGIVRYQEGALATRLIPPPCKKVGKGEAIWVEHLFPQDNSEWVRDIDSWGSSLRKMSTRLHSIGNITVLPMKENIQLGKLPLSLKQDGLRSFQIPQWKMNNEFLTSTQWTQTNIDRRTVALTELCLKIWKLPSTASPI